MDTSSQSLSGFGNINNNFYLLFKKFFLSSKIILKTKLTWRIAKSTKSVNDESWFPEIWYIRFTLIPFTFNGGKRLTPTKTFNSEGVNILSPLKSKNNFFYLTNF